jgi:hypothetical protein
MIKTTTTTVVTIRADATTVLYTDTAALLHCCTAAAIAATTATTAQTAATATTLIRCPCPCCNNCNNYNICYTHVNVYKIDTWSCLGEWHELDCYSCPGANVIKLFTAVSYDF